MDGVWRMTMPVKFLSVGGWPLCFSSGLAKFQSSSYPVDLGEAVMAYDYPEVENLVNKETLEDKAGLLLEKEKGERL